MRIGLRGSPSWPGEALRPDTLKQTDQSQMKITLADGAGHTFKGGGLIRGGAADVDVRKPP